MFKIRQFIVGVVIHGFGIHLFRHLDVFPRGSNVTIEVFHRVFGAILAVKQRLPRKFYIQVGCGLGTVCGELYVSLFLYLSLKILWIIALGELL